jgi:hypothetical protein
MPEQAAEELSAVNVTELRRVVDGQVFRRSRCSRWQGAVAEPLMWVRNYLRGHPVILTCTRTMTKTMTKLLLYMFNMLHMESMDEELQPVDASVSYCNSAV